MSLTYDIDVESRIVVLICGDTSLERWRRTMVEVFADPRFQPGFAVLVDCRTATLAPLTSDVFGVVDFLSSRRTELAQTRWAVVVEEPAGFGMARMTAAVAESAGIDLHAFQRVDEALAWLVGGASRHVGAVARVTG
jgi:hypothetical protein